MPVYTVRDKESGRVVTFRWNDAQPPTDADLNEVFAQARHTPPPSDTPAQPSAPPMRRSRTGALYAPPAELDLTNTVVNALPMVGGAVGGLLGAATGIPTAGLTGVPAAIAGAGLLGAGGEAAKQLINRARGMEAPQTPTDAALQIGKEGLVQGGAEGLGSAVSAGLGKGAQMVYRGYLKPSLSQRMLPKAQQVVETALDEALPISKAGTAKAQAVIGELRGEVDRLLQQSPASVDLMDIGDKIRAFAKQRYYRPGADLADYQTALAVADKIDKHPSLGLAPGMRGAGIDVPLAAANETKRALDTSITEAGFGAPSGAKKTTEKFARHTIRQELEAKAPEIAPLNARESKLIDASRAIAKAVEREANQNPIYGVKSLASAALNSGGYAAGLASGPAAVAGTLAARLAMHPPVASWAAIVASKISKELGVSMTTATRLADYVVSEGGQQDAQQPQ